MVCQLKDKLYVEGKRVILFWLATCPAPSLKYWSAWSVGRQHFGYQWCGIFFFSMKEGVTPEPRGFTAMGGQIPISIQYRSFVSPLHARTGSSW